MAHSSNQSTLNILAPRDGLILTFGHEAQVGVSSQTASISTRGNLPNNYSYKYDPFLRTMNHDWVLEKPFDNNS